MQVQPTIVLALNAVFTKDAVRSLVMYWNRNYVAAMLLIALLPALCFVVYFRYLAATALPRPLYSFPNNRLAHEDHADAYRGGVASESSLCSRIGITLIEEGGNAADAVRSGVNQESTMDAG